MTLISLGTALKFTWYFTQYWVEEAKCLVQGTGVGVGRSAIVSDGQ